ncbi:copper resistance protein NlpE [Stenoxybacter acetivorans]|uniref:copper resistance protein NlpE n=1 Tax=Stenoxybacter acetivorans TaxID=422441 RepID=UPI0005643A37|nr:copper resistance protein NlpE [Stenoxybacter acetivorans]
MKTNKIFAALATIALLSACGTSSAPVISKAAATPPAMINDGHNAQNSLTWWGTYTGTVPCADCAGIETNLVLNENGSFVLTQTYLKGMKPGKPFVTKGNFSWNKQGNMINLPIDREIVPYFVGENYLTQYYMDGSEPEGELAPMYRLKKIN